MVTLPAVITLLVTLPTILVYIKGIVKVFQCGNITPCGTIIGKVTNHFDLYKGDSRWKQHDVSLH